MPFRPPRGPMGGHHHHHHHRPPHHRHHHHHHRPPPMFGHHHHHRHYRRGCGCFTLMMTMMGIAGAAVALLLVLL